MIDFLMKLHPKDRRSLLSIRFFRPWSSAPWLTDLVWQGVTYCGESSASSLTMANVPWHQEVVAFVQQLAAMLPEYEIACEHEHSNCLLIAHEKVRGAASASKGTKSDFCWKDKESQT